MPFTYHTPPGIREPFAHYSHGVEVPKNHRLLLCSGQLGIAADDTIPEDVTGQAELCFANIASILAAANMSFAHIVRLNTFVTDRSHLGPYMQVRDRLFGSPPPASTLMIVSGFARAAFQIEIEALAAAPDDG